VRYPCPDCRKNITPTKNDRYRSHTDGEGEPCPMSSDAIPAHILENGPVDVKAPADVPVAGVDYQRCPNCDRRVRLTRLGYFDLHQTTLRGEDRCPVSGVRAAHARKIDDLPLPSLDETSTDAATESTAPNAAPAANAESDESWESPSGSAPAASSGASTATSSPESVTTPEPSMRPETEPSPPDPFSLGTRLSDRFHQPWSPFLQPTEWKEPKPVFLQPPEYNGPVKPAPMGDLAKELATKIKETFYSYSNRKTADNRSAQVTLGPSEIGTPCDRRLAMTLMGIPAVNPGGDGWAAFVGTCGHVGMGEIYEFADAGTGRYAVEMRVNLGNPLVPKGTSDLLDRRDGTIVDWKFMGKYSLDKFRLNGPSDTYRIQAHTYGYGAELSGEKVKNVAVVGLPRAGGSLDEMHVWTEKYDKKVALAALKRVEDINRETLAQGKGVRPDMEIAATFPVADDCRYCPFHLPKDVGFTRGCPGK
jgi:hypothetical protein